MSSPKELSQLHSSWWNGSDLNLLLTWNAGFGEWAQPQLPERNPSSEWGTSYGAPFPCLPAQFGLLTETKGASHPVAQTKPRWVTGSSLTTGTIGKALSIAFFKQTWATCSAVLKQGGKEVIHRCGIKGKQSCLGRDLAFLLQSEAELRKSVTGCFVFLHNWGKDSVDIRRICEG